MGAADPMTRWCGMPGCNALLVFGPGATPSNRCTEHKGQAAPRESDADKATRVRIEMGWEKPRDRR